MVWEQPLARLVGQRTATALAKLELTTGADLLLYFPRRYTAPGTLTDLSGLQLGDHVTVTAEVLSTQVRTMRNRRGAMLETKLSDGNAIISITFFASRPQVLRLHEDRLRPGRSGLFTGTVRAYRGDLQLTHPDYILLHEDGIDEAEAITQATSPIPIYAASAAIPTWRIQQAVRTVLDPLRPEDVAEQLPKAVVAEAQVLARYEALRLIHQPQTESDWQQARYRFKFEEAWLVQATFARRKMMRAHESARPRPMRKDGILTRFDAQLPFDLTPGQVAAGAEISSDLARDQPMLRLLQGDVGAGKTVVALRAMLQVVDAGGQAALVAPTEILAAQHAQKIADLLGDLGLAGQLGGSAEIGTRVTLLTGSMSTTTKRQALADIASGESGIIIGTHALFSEQVQFFDLGLVVVDEQHRFGVEQRDTLRTQPGALAHMLVMTATPIPRTVALTVFGDLEVTLLRDLPAGRAETVTHIVPAANRAWVERVWTRIRDEVTAGRQAYVVCARITQEEDSETEVAGGALAGVVEVAAQLRQRPDYRNIRIGELHSQLDAEVKDRTMAAFAAGQIQVLVATTMVEVGVDVPNATVMAVLDADRFGLSQLHQLRGRIGRGSASGICLLVSGVSAGTPAHQRLETLVHSTDGFELAEADLAFRREGDVLGKAQSGGKHSFRALQVVEDVEIISAARASVQKYSDIDPGFKAPPLTSVLTDLEDAQPIEFLGKV